MTHPSRRRLAVAACLLALLVAACGGPPTDDAGDVAAGAPAVAPSAPAATESPLDAASVEELATQAAEEGEVVVYSFTSRIADVETAFEEQYPDVDLVGLDISATEQIQRLIAEQQAGVAEADVAFPGRRPRGDR